MNNATERADRCKVPGCERAVKACGECRSHYNCRRKYGSYDFPLKRKPVKPKPLESRFWSKVPDRPDSPEECWEWAGGRSPGSYGRFHLSKSPSRSVVAHRQSWILAHGPIPEGMLVCHHCDNPPCVRPSHLFLGDQADNMADMKAKGRRLGKVAVRGEEQALSVLKAKDIPLIRAQAQTKSLGELSAEFGTTKGNIWAVIHRKSWKHIA